MITEITNLKIINIKTISKKGTKKDAFKLCYNKDYKEKPKATGFILEEMQR